MPSVRSWFGAALTAAVTISTIFVAHAQTSIFEVDPSWPKSLPNNWITGQIGGIAVDDKDNVWAFQRPRSLTDDNLPAYNSDSPQFANPVHSVTLAKDGIVYVCDRTNNRVRVFHKDGRFVRQFVFDPATRGTGSAWGLAFPPLDDTQNYLVLIDDGNNVLETVRRADGAVVAAAGRPGRNAGEFHLVHAGAFDSHGNFFNGEVDTGRRLQKWVPAQ